MSLFVHLERLRAHSKVVAAGLGSVIGLVSGLLGIWAFWADDSAAQLVAVEKMLQNTQHQLEQTSLLREEISQLRVQGLILQKCVTALPGSKDIPLVCNGFIGAEQKQGMSPEKPPEHKNPQLNPDQIFRVDSLNLRLNQLEDELQLIQSFRKETNRKAIELANDFNNMTPDAVKVILLNIQNRSEIYDLEEIRLRTQREIVLNILHDLQSAVGNTVRGRAI